MTAPTGGTTAPTQSNGTIAQGALFGFPKYGTMRRFVPDNNNQSIAVTPLSGSQVNAPMAQLDQLDIVIGEKLTVNYTGTWTEGSSETLYPSPFFPANIISFINVKLQAAYSTMNVPGWLAAVFQGFRPMFGNRQLGQDNGNLFTSFTAPSMSTSGAAYDKTFTVDIPLALHFDEYFDLAANGDAQQRVFDTWVTPYMMAAQTRVVTPSLLISPQLSTNDLLGAPVTKVSADTTSTYSNSSTATQLHLSRDAFFTGDPAANPPLYPWMYTRDYFSQGTSGQNQVGVLLQNTGTSLGQVLSVVGMLWDPSLNSGRGGVVPMSSISTISLVTGGSLQNLVFTPSEITDRMASMYGNTFVSALPSGIFIIDFALSTDGATLSNANAINTYLLNGVQLNIAFNTGDAPGNSATAYVGVEALKLATS